MKNYIKPECEELIINVVDSLMASGIVIDESAYIGFDKADEIL